MCIDVWGGVCEVELAMCGCVCVCVCVLRFGCFLCCHQRNNHVQE